MTLADDLGAAFPEPTFAAYAGRDLGAHGDLRERLLESVASVLGEEHLTAIREHLDRGATRERFYDGVSRARADRETYWEDDLEKFRRRTSHVGAVQLELGVWERFGDEVRDRIVRADGLAELIRLDFDGRYPVDVVGDARRLPFGDATIDRISADSVLEHVPHPHEVIRECFRVLRPGGFVRFATPFIFSLHGYPDDHLRYTPSWYEQVCGEAGFEVASTDVDAARGLYYTLHNCMKAAVVEEDAPGAPGLRALHLALIELLGLLAPLDNGFVGRSAQWFHSVRCMAVKAGPLDLSHREPRPGVPFAERCLDLLACPQTRAPLRREGDVLVSDATGVRYPVRADGVPDFVAAQRPERAPRRRWGRRR